MAEVVGWFEQLFTGSAGVPPATRRRREVLQSPPSKLYSRSALIAGGTPALPVRKLDVTLRLTHHRHFLFMPAHSRLPVRPALFTNNRTRC